jgi:hypothetical protein
MASWLKHARNWRGETKTQELERRVKALESSLPAAHERINDLDERLGSHRHLVPTIGATSTPNDKRVYTGSMYGAEVDDS